MSNVKYLNPLPASAPGPARQLPRPLRLLAEQVSGRLEVALLAMLDGADDRLFDLAQSATDAEQARYFDAMRALRLGREGLIGGFRRRLEQSFAGLVESSDEAALSERAVDMDSLSLVADAEVEVDLALTNMARRVREPCAEQLRAFNHRLEYLLEGQLPVDERNSPLDPAQLANAFRCGFDDLDLDIHAALIILKLFERMVLGAAGVLVSDANKALADAGVLPDLKTVPIKPARTQSSPSRTMSATSEEAMAAPAGAPEALFSQLRELLGGGPAAPSGMPTGTAAHAGLPGFAVIRNGQAWMDGAPMPAEQVQSLTSADLVGLLDRLQRLEQQVGEAAPPLDRQLSELVAEQGDEGSLHALSDVDSDVINLVSMLFDFILDDQELAGEIKALLGRLQIPLLKVAISDAQFFARDDHPARMLLDGLARLGSYWSSHLGENDALFGHVSQAVSRVLNEFESDENLFLELLEQLDIFERQHQRRTERLEQRLHEVEEGRLRAEQARAAVASLVEQRIAGRQLPVEAMPLVSEAWPQVLYLTHLRDGDDSESWQRRARLTDALIWSVLPHTDPQASERLSKLAPQLQKGLDAGFRAVGYDPLEAGRLLAGLNDLHQRVLLGLETQRAKVPSAAEQERAVSSSEGAEQESAALSDDHPTVRTLREIKAGLWFDFSVPDDGDDQRCRLAANIRRGSKLVFINARGIKVAQYSANQLAALLEQGRARQVRDGRLFDRALEAMIADLRHSRAQAGISVS